MCSCRGANLGAKQRFILDVFIIHYSHPHVSLERLHGVLGSLLWPDFGRFWPAMRAIISEFHGAILVDLIFAADLYS